MTNLFPVVPGQNVTGASSQRRTTLQLICLFLPFLASIVGTYVWFNLGNAHPSRRFESSAAGVWFSPRADIPGFSFLEEPVSGEVQKILGTTNILSGAFVPQASDSDVSPRRSLLTVFIAKWRPSEGKGLADIEHTPDICWLGAGWKPCNIGNPLQTKVPLGGSEVLFECRAFLSPEGNATELVLWCTVIGGQVISSPSNLTLGIGSTDIESLDRRIPAATSRNLGIHHFQEAVRKRISGKVAKQFVRYSMPVVQDWRNTLEALKEFGPAWLESGSPAAL